MRKLIPGLLACVSLLVGLPVASFGADDPPPLQIQSPEVAAFLHSRQPKPYTRIARPDTNTVQLQIAVRRLVSIGGGGPDVWLVGTSHIGETNYYKELQNLLDARTVVLYEGVNTGAHQHHVPKPGTADETNAPLVVPGRTNEGFSIQPALAHALGLVFQLDAINYDRANFLNSDLSVLQIQRLMIGDPDAQPAAPGEEGRNDSTFNSLIQIMDGSSFLGSVLKWGVQLISASSQMQAITKLTLIETLGQLKGDFADMHGLPADMRQLVQVLIAARNENVVNDLKTELKTVPTDGSIAIFYGTGHMDDMERRIRDDLSYQPAEDIWLTAFSVDFRKTGLDASELKYIEKMVATELAMLRGGSGKKATPAGKK